MNIESQQFWEYFHKKQADQGYKHILNAFFEIQKRKDFLSDIQKLRKKYHIPKDGFSKENQTEYWKWSMKYNEELSKAVFDDVYKLTKKFHLPKEWWKAVMEALFHDSKDIGDLGFGTTSGLCVIEDLGDKISKDYPIAIKISPYASKRDILEFIKLTYSHEIETKQKRYRDESSLIGKVKSKNPDIQRRDDFIYKNRDLSRKVLVAMVGKKFKKEFSEPINEGSVGKIISREKKKRQDV